MSEKVFSKGEAIRFGWKTMNDHLGFFIGLTLITMMLGFVPGLVAGFLKESMPILASLIRIVSQIVSIIIAPGYIKIYLDFCDNQSAQFSDLFAYVHLFWRYLGASLLMGLAVMGGFICLIIPGIILSIKLQFFGYLLVDQDQRAVDSLKKSYQMTKGLFGELFVLSVLLGLINLAGFLCLGIGLLATIPTTTLATAFVYRKIINQSEATAVPVA